MRNPRVANPIAVRRYRVIGEPAREVVLTIGKPRPDPDSRGDWYSTVLIEGLPRERRKRVHGVDAVQALQLAMVYARRKIEASGLRLTLYGAEADDFGLPHPVPSYDGSGFTQKIERLIEEEHEKFGEALRTGRFKKGDRWR